MGIRTRGGGNSSVGSLIIVLLALFACVKAGGVTLDASLQATNGIGVKVLGATLSIVGLVLASVFLGFILIEGVLVATIVYPEYRGHAYLHLALGILVNGGFLIFFWISNFGGAVWLAPVVEVEFWFWVALTVSWSAWIVSWSLRVGPDFDRKGSNIDMSNPDAYKYADLGSGRSWFWGFVTVGMTLCATFALYDITTLMLPLGISAIVFAVFWLIFWYLSFDNASRRARVLGRNVSKRSIYSWLKWNHIFVLLIFIFYTILFILGPGLGAVTDYQGIMIGYVISYGLQGLSTHAYFFIFDYNKRKRTPMVQQQEAMQPMASHPNMGNTGSIFNAHAYKNQ